MVDCAVCLSPVTDACLAPCRHIYCRQCIIKVLAAKPPEWSGQCPLCRAQISVYNLRDGGGTLLAEPERRTLYGSVFVQGGTLGLASYHFDGPDDCYISYANAPRAWTLADGSRPPEKKPWTDHSFDAETLTFRGVISWDPSFGGMDRWDYEIVFSEDFSCVIGGHVEMRCTDGNTRQQPFEVPWERSFNRALAYLRLTPPPETIFGTVFVQGRAYAPLLEGIASYHFDAEDDCYISYSNAPDVWKLDDGNRPPKKKNFVNPRFDVATRTFRGTVEWDPTFNGEARWEYEMVFAEDYGSIVGGQLCSYAQDGARRDDTVFVDPHNMFAFLRAGSSGMSYVQKPQVLTSGARVMRALQQAEDQDSNVAAACSEAANDPTSL